MSPNFAKESQNAFTASLLAVTCQTTKKLWLVLVNNSQISWENHEHQKYFWNLIVLQEKSLSGVTKLNRTQER